MTDLRRVPPGRAGRLWLLHRKQIAERGIDLLDRKLPILRAEQQRFHLIEQGARERWEQSATVARQWLVRAAVLGGQRDLRHATPMEPATVRLTWAAVMGVRYPADVKCLLPPQDPGAIGPGNAAMTPAIVAHRDALQAGAVHATALTARAAIDAEVVEVRRRLTAIRDRWLPRLEQALRDFERNLEETERSEVARLRRLMGSARQVPSGGNMAITRILVAVDDSAGSLAAARLAVDVAAKLGAELHALVVAHPETADPVLKHVAGLAMRSSVPISLHQAQADVAPATLAQAKAHSAHLVVLGRSLEAGYGQPYVGSQTRLVLEFATVPVLVVPPP